MEKLAEACGYDENEQCRSEPGLDGDLQLLLDHLLDLLRQLADGLVMLLETEARDYANLKINQNVFF